MIPRFMAFFCLLTVPAVLNVSLSGAVEGYEEPDSFLVYIGTYTGPESKGIYTFRLDRQSGKLTAVNKPTQTSNPSFVAVHPSGDCLLYTSPSPRD